MIVKILFAATGEIAVKTLETLNGMGLVRAVLTTPDVPGKRGKKLLPSPVKVKALELGLEVIQPERLRTEAREEVKALGADTLVSFCYGKIFGPKFLALFDRTFNIHPSMLPKYRGCAPIYQTILNRDRMGGITIQEIALEVDSGDVINTMEYELDGRENDSTLDEKVSVMAAELAEKTFSDIASFPPRKQEGEATYSGFIEKSEAELDFSRPARELHAQIRACYPWPKAVVKYGESSLFLTDVSGSVFDEFEKTEGEKPGTVVAFVKKRGFKIATGDGYLYVSKVQAPAKKEMDAASYLNGDRGIISSVLGE